MEMNENECEMNKYHYFCFKNDSYKLRILDHVTHCAGFCATSGYTHDPERAIYRFKAI